MMVDDLDVHRCRGNRNEGEDPESKHGIQPECGERERMTRLTRGGTAKTLARDRSLRGERGWHTDVFFLFNSPRASLEISTQSGERDHHTHPHTHISR